MSQTPEFKRVAKIIRNVLTKEELVRFSDLLDNDAYHDFECAVNEEVMEVAPEIFGELESAGGNGLVPQTPRDETGQSPPLESDPRAQRCERHGLLLYPGELCQSCLAESLG